MTFDKWAMLYSALIFLVSGIRDITAQSCGGHFYSSYGSFASPNYPNVYDTNDQCTYTISLSTISSITLSFDTFELDRSSGDYVSITCESNSSYPQQIFYWDSIISPVSIPWCSIVRFYFYSDYYRYYATRGFKVQYQVNTKDCGNTVFNSSSGIISSPNYPQEYNDNENCTFSIWAPQSSSFALNFKAFNVGCDRQQDWIQIRCENSGQILPKHCGLAVPNPVYIINCNKVLVWFHTDAYRNYYNGFSLQYSTTPDGCGESNYYGLSGIITSPNYPNGYNKMSCYYYLYPVSSVTLLFQSFDLEPFIDSSDGDYVQIECYSNSSHSSHLYRGNTLPPLLSYTLCSVIHINFYANAAVSGTGFNVKYQINPLVADSVIINEPKNFTVYVGNGVQLDCESSAYGYYPSWTLSKDGTNEDSTVIASFCVLNSDYTYTYNYYVEKRGSGACTLVITSASTDEAGVYTCIDVGLASISSVVTVVYPYDTDDSDVIGLAVTLAISILVNIGVAIYFIVRQNRKIPREEEDQRNSDQERQCPNDYAMTQATGSDINACALSPGSSNVTAKDDEDHYEHLNYGFSNLATIDTRPSP